MFEAFRKLGRAAAIASVVALLALLAVLGWAILSPAPPSRPKAPRVATRAEPKAPAPPAAPAQASCGGDSADEAASALNARSVDGAGWSPFGRGEAGWRIYAPLVQRELATACPPESPGFAKALLAWRKAQGQPGDGALDEAAFRAMGQRWLLRRPFLQAMRFGCPPSPGPEALAVGRPEEGYNGKRVMALPPALDAYRRMVADARAASAEIAADPKLLTIFSSYRGPAEEAARCATGDCNNTTKASCSAHRTGTAFDLYLGAAPGSAPESSADANRRFQAGSPAYRWLAANADRYGFLPYPFEPWHWEWAGVPTLKAQTAPEPARLRGGAGGR